MKRFIAIFLCLLLCFSLAACGNDNDKDTESGEPSDVIRYEELDHAVEGIHYEIVSVDYETLTDSIGVSLIKTFVVLKNISDHPLILYYTDNYSIYTEDDTFYENIHFFASTPKVVSPGEYGYLYGSYETIFLNGDEELYCEFDLDGILVLDKGRSAEDCYNYYEVTDFELSVDNDYALKLTGTFTCPVDDDVEIIYLQAIGFDKDDNPICCFTGQIYDFQPGETVEFSMTSLVYDSVTTDDIAYLSDIEAFSEIRN